MRRLSGANHSRSILRSRLDEDAIYGSERLITLVAKIRSLEMAKRGRYPQEF
jgi:hypothetical protein